MRPTPHIRFRRLLPAMGAATVVAISNPVSSTNSRTALLTVLADTIAPAVTGVSGGGTKILLTFSEPLDLTSAGNPANYSLSGGVGVTGATVSGQVVTLTTASALPVNSLYSVTINGVKDLYNNVVRRSLFLADDSY